MTCVSRLARDVELGHERPISLGIYSYVDVWSAAGVGYGLDGEETIAPPAVRARMAYSLKAGVNGSPTGVPRMPVAAIRIALPDLYTHTLQGIAVAVQQTPGQVRDVTLRRLVRSCDMHQVIIIIQGQLRRVERSSRLGGVSKFACTRPGASAAAVKHAKVAL